MRGFLLFIALAFPLALMSPSFWALVGMEFGTTPVTYWRHDGSVQQALLGPRAPWPGWALIPDGARLKVRAWFGPSTSDPETGFGDLTFAEAPQAVVAAYVAKLQSEGWHVETSTFRAMLPDLPPRQLVSCRISATRDGGDHRAIHAAIEFAPQPGSGNVHWFATPPAAWKGYKGEAC